MIENEYKEVYLGPKKKKIPKEWDFKPVDTFSKKVTDGTHSTPNYTESGIPFLSTKNLKPFHGEFDFSDYVKYISREDHDELIKRSKPEKGDILISKSGTIGRTQKVRSDKEFSIFVGLALIKPEQEKVQSDYLEQFFNADFIQSVLDIKAPGSTRKTLNVGTLKKQKVILPSLSEQRRIATILSTVDEQIQQTDDIIEETKELKQGLMQDLLIGGLSNGATQEIQIGPRTLDIPDHWAVESCGHLFEAINGRAFKTEEWEEEGTQIIRIQDLRPDAEAETNYADFEVDEKFHVTHGDLLFCWAGNIKTSLGAYIWSGDDAYLNQHIYNLRPKKELDKQFFAYSLNKHLRLLKTMVGGSAGQVHITKADFEGFELPVPPVGEQERISNIIGCVEKKIEEEKNKKHHLQELKRGLMQDLLTGKVRVNTN